jgi:putative selenate reductase FAD-binding subunit
MIQEFYRPKSVKEAITLKAKVKKAAWLAGGTELNCLHTQPKPAAVIALDGLKLDAIKATASGLSIGACVTLQSLCDSKKVPAALRAAAANVVNRNVRNIATLGGNIGAGKSCSNLIPALMALGAKLKIAAKTGMKTLAVDEYLAAPKDLLILGVDIPKSKIRVAQRVFRRTANDISLITVAAGITQAKGIVTGAVVAVGGVNKRVVRLKALEQSLIDTVVPHDDSIAMAVKADKAVAPISDVRGSAEFKRHLAGVLVAEAVAEGILQ